MSHSTTTNNFPSTIPPSSPSWPRTDPPIVIAVTLMEIPIENRRDDWRYCVVDQWEGVKGESVLVLIGEGCYHAGFFFLVGLEEVKRLEVVGVGEVVFDGCEGRERSGVEEIRICNVRCDGFLFGTEVATRVLEMDNVLFVDESGLWISEASVVCNSLELVVRDCYFSSPFNLIVMHDALIENTRFSGSRGDKIGKFDEKRIWQGNVNIQIQEHSNLVMKNCLFDERNDGHAIEVQSHLGTQMHKMMHMVMPGSVEQTLVQLNIQLSENTIHSPTCHLCNSKRNTGVCATPEEYQLELFKENAHSYAELLNEGRRKYREELPESPARDFCIKRWGLSEPFPWCDNEKWLDYSTKRLQVEFRQDTLSLNSENSPQSYQEIIQNIQERLNVSLSTSAVSQNPSIENYTHQLMNRRTQIEMLLFCLVNRYPLLPKEILSKIIFYVNFPDNSHLIIKNICFTDIEANYDMRGNVEHIRHSVRIYSPHGINYVDFTHLVDSHRLYTYESIYACIDDVQTQICTHNRDNFRRSTDINVCTVEILNRIQTVLYGNPPVFSPLKLLELILTSLYLSNEPEQYFPPMNQLITTKTKLFTEESLLPDLQSQLTWNPQHFTNSTTDETNLYSELQSILFN